MAPEQAGRPIESDVHTVMVLGMHRSGTSAITGALAAMGLDLGGDPLMEASPDNPTGHFEVGRLCGLNDEILDAVGGRWSAPPPDGAALNDLATGELGRRARALVDEVFTRPGWVWKDPRAALLLPFWRAVLVPEPLAVVVARHPLAVARSLAARDGMAVDYGLALWERYTRALLRDLRGMRAHVVDYDDIMAEPQQVVTELTDFLGDGFDRSPHDLSAATRSLVPDHRHQVVDDADAENDPAMRAEVLALHRVVETAVGTHDVFPAVDLGVESPNLQVAFTEHKRLSRYEERMGPLEAERDLQDERIKDLWAEIDRRSAEATSLFDELVVVSNERAEIAGRLERLERWWLVRLARKVRRMTRRTA